MGHTAGMGVRTEEEGGIISNTQPHDARVHTHTHTHTHTRARSAPRAEGFPGTRALGLRQINPLMSPGLSTPSPVPWGLLSPTPSSLGRIDLQVGEN